MLKKLVVYSLLFCTVGLFSRDWITVFVHGTTWPDPVIHYVSSLKQQCFKKNGMHLATDLLSGCLYRSFAESLSSKHADVYSLAHFYVYGWSGYKVSHTYRKQVGRDLLKQIRRLVHEYRAQYNKNPKLRLIGYSHGGNVILNAASAFPLYVVGEKIHVEGISIASPVQEVTAQYATKDYFDVLYLLYSYADYIQRLPLQISTSEKLKFVFSGRYIQNNFCKNICVTVDNKYVGHLAFKNLFYKIHDIIQTAQKAPEYMVSLNIEKSGQAALLYSDLNNSTSNMSVA